MRDAPGHSAYICCVAGCMVLGLADGHDDHIVRAPALHPTCVKPNLIDAS